MKLSKKVSYKYLVELAQEIVSFPMVFDVPSRNLGVGEVIKRYFSHREGIEQLKPEHFNPPHVKGQGDKK